MTCKIMFHQSKFNLILRLNRLIKGSEKQLNILPKVNSQLKR